VEKRRRGKGERGEEGERWRGGGGQVRERVGEETITMNGKM